MLRTACMTKSKSRFLACPDILDSCEGLGLSNNLSRYKLVVWGLLLWNCGVAAVASRLFWLIRAPSATQLSELLLASWPNPKSLTLNPKP